MMLLAFVTRQVKIVSNVIINFLLLKLIMKFAKIAAVAVVALGGFAFASAASAVTAASIYSPATGFLKMGSGMGAMAYQAPQVMAAQTALNACVPGMALAIDGKMGPLTTAKFKAFQASKMIAQDGIIGPITAAQLAACSGDNSSTPSTPSTGLQGGAGDLEITTFDEDTESTVVEGEEEKVYSLTLEANDSDIAVTNIKVSMAVDQGSNNGSLRVDKYFDEVLVYLDNKEVGSVDADEFSKQSGNVYTKSIALKNAIIDEDEEAVLSIAVKTLSSVDETDSVIEITATEIRYSDATGAILTLGNGSVTGANTNVNDGLEYVAEVDFEEEGFDDSLDLSIGDDNPDASNLKVEDDTSKSDEFVVLVGELEADEDGSDIEVTFGQITVEADNNGAVSDSNINTKIVDKIYVKVAGKTYTANYADSTSNNVATYDVDFKSGFTVDAGDIEDIEISAIFKGMNNGSNYASGTTVNFTFEVTEAEGADELSGSDLGGDISSEEHTLVISEATIDDFAWVAGTAGTNLSFEFTVSADDENYTVDIADIADQITEYVGDVNAGILEVTGSSSSNNYTVVNAGSEYIVKKNKEVSFRVFYVVDTPTNGDSYKVKVTTVSGTTVPSNRQTSPTVTVNGL